jgi:phosphoglycolate phosphatase
MSESDTMDPPTTPRRGRMSAGHYECVDFCRCQLLQRSAGSEVSPAQANAGGHARICPGANRHVAVSPITNIRYCYVAVGIQLIFSRHYVGVLDGISLLKTQSEKTILAATLPYPPKVIIFDFDGVILDSANIKLRAYSAIYSGEDPKKLAALIAHSQFHGGITRRIKFEYYEREFFGRNADSVRIEALCQHYSDIVFKAVLACPFIEGAEQLLRGASSKVAMHVVSGTPDSELHRVIQQRGLAEFFRSVRGAPATKRDAFQRIATDEGYALKDMLVVGDSMTEYIAAQDIGIPFLGIVPGGIRGSQNPFPASVHVWPTLRDAEKRLRIA